MPVHENDSEKNFRKTVFSGTRFLGRGVVFNVHLGSNRRVIYSVELKSSKTTGGGGSQRGNETERRRCSGGKSGGTNCLTAGGGESYGDVMRKRVGLGRHTIIKFSSAEER